MTSVNAALDFANLNTASAAREIWFNSKYHVRAFLAGVAALVAANDELAAQDPLSALTAKIRYMPPPVDMSLVREMLAQGGVVRDKRTLFVETRDANINLLNSALSILKRRGEQPQLLTIGPVEHLTTDIPRQTVTENDLAGQVRAILQATVFASTRIAAPFDEHAVRALLLGMRAVLPRTGVYPELLPKAMHGFCLYDVDADSLASRLQDALYQPTDLPARDKLEKLLSPFDAIAACKAIDERLSEVAEAHAPAHQPGRAPRL